MKKNLLLNGITRLFINLVVASLFTYLLLIYGFDGDFKTQNILDAGFAIGFIFLSVGIITASNAGQVFDGMRFVLKQWFSRKQYTHLAFYDYKQSRRSEREPMTGIFALLVGIIFIAVSGVMGFTK